MNERAITIVSIAPKVKRNSFSFKSPITSVPINAAWLAPKPGRKAVNGLAIIEARVDFAIEDFGRIISFNFLIFCSGIFVFSFREINKVLAPNNPVNNGRRGW